MTTRTDEPMTAQQLVRVLPALRRELTVIDKAYAVLDSETATDYERFCAERDYFYSADAIHRYYLATVTPEVLAAAYDLMDGIERRTLRRAWDHGRETPFDAALMVGFTVTR